MDISGPRLLLNPRFPEETRTALETAWRDLVVPRFARRSVVGIVTSGSSGDARGRLIVLSKEALLANAASVNELFAAGARDVWMKTLPSFHVGGLGIYLRASLSGSRVVESALEKWNARDFYRELEESRATLLSLVPTQLFDLVTFGRRAPNGLRAVILGGARLEGALRERASALGWPVHASYGMTECGSQIATSVRPGDPRLRPLSHAQVRTSAPGGRIELRSPALLSAQILFDLDGARLAEYRSGDWFATDDYGRIEDDGSLTVLGRGADFVKIAGEGVVLARLEERLENLKVTLAYRGDAAVLAVEDERLGAAIVLLTDDVPGAGPLIESFNAGVAPFERIRAAYGLDKLPRSDLGKLQRGVALTQLGLRAAVADGALGAGASRVTDDGSVERANEVSTDQPDAEPPS